MKVRKLNLHHLHIPLKLTFAQANQRTRSSASLIARVETERGTVGYGESCPRTYVTGESMDSATRAIERLQVSLQRQSFRALSELRDWVLARLDEGCGPAAVCALELALLDAWCQEQQVDLVEALGGSMPQVWQYSGVVPYGDWSRLEPILRKFRFPAWKVKAYAQVEDNLALVAGLQSLPTGGDRLRLDANGGWSLAQAQENIAALLDRGLTSFEQPLAAKAEKDMATLVKAFGDYASIMADESLITLADAERLVAQERCNHFNLKVSKHGGIFATMRILAFARERGIPCQLGAHYGETGLLTAAGMVVAALAPELTALEGGLGTHLLQDDLVLAPLMVDARGRIGSDGLSFPGWPRAVDALKLNRYAQRTYFWESTKTAFAI